MNNLLSKLFMCFFVALFSVNAYSAENFTAINVKAFYGYIDSNAPYLSDKNHYFLEVETIARQDRWDFYGFFDAKIEKGNVNADFFKYILKFDVLDNNKLYVVGEIKETFADQDGASFLGLGTSFDFPIIGNLNVNAMYFMADKDAHNIKIETPFMLQFSWFKDFGSIDNSKFSIYQAGWSDIDFYEKRKDYKPKNHYSFQIYQAVGVNYETYGAELGYKYWYGMGGTGDIANSVFVYLIKRF